MAGITGERLQEVLGDVHQAPDPTPPAQHEEGLPEGAHIWIHPVHRLRLACPHDLVRGLLGLRRDNGLLTRVYVSVQFLT